MNLALMRAPMILLPMTALDALTAVHCGEGAAVAFARSGTGGWEECGACLTSELQDHWPNLEAQLGRDAYFGLASTYKQDRTTRVSALGLPLWSRKAQRLRWLNTVVVDLDQHEAQRFSSEAFLESFWRELELQQIPSPTFISFSGRGLWGLWQLKSFLNQSEPVQAFPDKRGLAQRINRALADRFAHLGADRSATDTARVMRLPNSINSKATPENSRVHFFRVNAATYTLPELADALGVRACKVFLPGERTGPKNPAKQKAAVLRWRHPLEGFRALWKMRGVFTERTRRTAIYVYAVLLRKNRATPQEVLSSCLRLAESLVPPVSAADVRRQITASEKAIAYNFRNAKFAKMLKITPQERAALPRWFRTTKERKSVRIAKRRAVIAHELSLCSQPASTRQLVRILKEKHGIAVSQRTVARDLRNLPESFSLLIELKSPSLHKQKKCHTLVCPSSMHPDGTVYECLGEMGEDKPFTAAPRWLLAAIKERYSGANR